MSVDPCCSRKCGELHRIAAEANATEDIPVASADERQEEERAATPPTNQEVVLEENVSVPEPPATQVEVENLEAPH